MVSSLSSTADDFRFGRLQPLPTAQGWSVQWLLKRNCSLAPCQLLQVYAFLCAVSLGVAAVFWLHGATLVLPFAWLEILAVGGAILTYGMHAGDSETIRLLDDSLTVEHASGRRTERIEFRPDRVRVEPDRGDGSLIELCGQGRRAVVGRFVRPELRPQLADELRRALRISSPWVEGGPRAGTTSED
jgi:uncharacterized membrane protein